MCINFKKWKGEYERYYKEGIDNYKKRIKAHRIPPIQYYDTGNWKEESSPYFESISRVLQKRGYLLKEEFISICEWKTKRVKRLYPKNSAKDIEKITGEVIPGHISGHLDTKAQIEELTKLKGVGVPVASAILTVIFPTYYCVVDYRAWRSLLWVTLQHKNYSKFSKVMNKFRNYASTDSYLYYLDEIKKLAGQYHMTPREIEGALWMYDKVHSPSK